MKPAAGSVLNFAYGSNMLRARIQARVPSARAIGTALLAAKALRWHKRGQALVVTEVVQRALVHRAGEHGEQTRIE